ncbi:hypothetical protein AMECASPLE_010264 [Ameca splendens]|uniref:Anoctamin n=1 Tax=Ameca splendens TaxID=208324 RepID=A0ABV0YYQ0_9TELE
MSWSVELTDVEEKARSPMLYHKVISGPVQAGGDSNLYKVLSNWLKPCCGRRVALWQVCLLSAGFNCVLVACVILVVLFLSLELLIDTKLLQFSSAFQFATIIHWISLIILSLFFSETVFRIVVLGIWDYIENKVEVSSGAPAKSFTYITMVSFKKYNYFCDFFFYFANNFIFLFCFNKKQNPKNNTKHKLKDRKKKPAVP